jgi:hypothetical protein
MLIKERFPIKSGRSFNCHKPIKFSPFIILFFLILAITFVFSNTNAVARELVFDPSPDEAFGKVEGYQLYYGKVEGSIESFDIENYEPKTLDLGMNTGHPLPLPDLEFEVGITYYFAATAYGYGKESALSEVLLYTVPENNYIINASAGTGGSISPSGNITVAHGESLTFGITPETGYDIKNVLVDGESMGAISTYTYDNVTADKTISVTFETTTYTINASAGTGGNISPSGKITVAHGESLTFGITPETGYEISEVLVDGKPNGAISSYTYENVTADKIISVTFKPIKYTIDASASTGGSINPSGKITVAHGESLTFGITPETGYEISEVLVDGESMGAISSYTFSNVLSSRIISVHFNMIPSDPTTHIIEMGEVSVNHKWQRVDFAEIFIDPVVVAKPASLNGKEPAVVRIQNVDTTGFEIRIQEWDYLDGVHRDEQISYLVIEKGSYVLPGGILMEAGSFEADGNKFKFNPFSNTFNQIPIVIASVTSVNEPNAVVGRINNVSHDGFDYYLQREEKNKKKHGVENVSFIACESFSGVLNQLKLEVGTTGNQVNHNFHYLSYNEKFLNIPYFLADMQTTNDTETANIRWQNKNLYSIELHISEEKSRDSELNHSNENVGYIIISDHE